jgi:hypothetical protein
LVAILPCEGKGDTAATQYNYRYDGNNERGVALLGFYREWRGSRVDRRCFHMFLQIMTE